MDPPQNRCLCGFRRFTARVQPRCGSVAPASGGEAEPHSGGFNSHQFAVDSHGGVQIDPPFRRRKTRSSLINSTGPLLHIRLLRSHFLPLPSTLHVGVTWPGLHFGSDNRYRLKQQPENFLSPRVRRVGVHLGRTRHQNKRIVTTSLSLDQGCATWGSRASRSSHNQGRSGKFFII